MRLEELDFELPEALIAQRPTEQRDACRLMHLSSQGAFHHRVFSELPNLLRRGDTLVLNDSRVLPARVHAHKPTGGSVELLFLRPVAAPDEVAGAAPVAGCGECWEVLARPSHRLRVGGELLLPGGERSELVHALGDGRWVLQGQPECSFIDLMDMYGLLPLPPYIKKYPEEPSSYQTVYAAVPGSAAAPTAGLHFTQALFSGLEEAGVKTAYVTLHVGLDTFQPIREPRVEDHHIHREAFSVSAHALRVVRDAFQSGERLVAVGTTATRVLETLVQTGLLDSSTSPASCPATSGSTEIFISPGYRFRAVGALLTNFHLPRSSVLALTMAFAGQERLLRAYAEAIRLEYRFFSFGDAMFIEPLAANDGEDDDADA